MKESDENAQWQQAVDDVAADWVVRRDRGLSACEQDAFFHWLAEDPRHGERYAIYARSWDDAALLAEWCPEHSDEPNPDLLRYAGRPRWLRWAALPIALAACLALLAWIALMFFDRADSRDFERNGRLFASDYRYEVLSDGSEIDMNQGSEIEVLYLPDRRVIKMISGEVHFNVVRDPARPFVVLAGGTEVKAIGTAFNVRCEGGTLEVLVTEGLVRWGIPLLDGLAVPSRPRSDVSEIVPSQGTDSAFDPSVASFAFHQNLTPGQKSRMKLSQPLRTPPVVETVGPDEVRALLSWKHELLEFDATPLAAAITEFNSRNDIKLVITENSLGDTPIVASFRSDNLGGFVRLLELVADVRADYSREGEILLQRSDPDTIER